MRLEEEKKPQLTFRRNEIREKNVHRAVEQSKRCAIERQAIEEEKLIERKSNRRGASKNDSSRTLKLKYCADPTEYFALLKMLEMILVLLLLFIIFVWRGL